jgi:murein DD-endopeptidase MepM/ murein hydrolase activator NlpD
MIIEDRPSWRQRAKTRLDRWFPERQIHLRTLGRVSFFRLSQGFQVSTAVVLTAAVGWAGFASYSYVLHDKIVVDKNYQIANARLAYQSLLGEVAEYQMKFTTITQDLEENHSLMLGLVEKNASLQQSLKSIATQLEVTESDRTTILSARERLKKNLAENDERLQQMASHNYSLKDNLTSIEGDLQSALSERNQALFDGTTMRRQIKSLETLLTNLQQSEETSVQRLTERTTAYIKDMERIVDKAGLEVAQLLKLSGGIRPEGQGGPFIPAADLLPAGRLKSELSKLDARLSHWEALQGAMRKLPLTVPLNAYYVTSGYGKRRDPINKRWSAHYGVDFGGTFKSRVYATSTGVVTYAGWKGKYGKLIEISHGAGLKTRYGHLHKILVKKGETVKFRQKIGLLGSTGRSTGSHLHYEVHFNGKAKDPMKFIRAGQNVFQE